MKLHLFLCLAIAGAFPVFAKDPKTFASFIELPWRYVIGGYADGKWLKSEVTGKRLTGPKTEYRLYSLTGEAGKVTVGKASPDSDVCPDVWMVPINPEPDMDKTSIGVRATWDPAPRIAKSLDTTQDVYVKAVTDLLLAKEITKPNVKIKQLLKVDLDGDGEDEVLIACSHYQGEEDLTQAKAGDYSFVALRRVVKGKVQTQILEGDFYPKTVKDAAPNTYKISGLLDLNGDGTLEVLVDSAYYEGGGLKVWQLQKDKLVTVLEIECGV